MYGTHNEASILVMVAGFMGKSGKQEVCGNEPVARDQALNICKLEISFYM